MLDIKTAYELEEKKMKEQESRNNSDGMMNVLMKDQEFFNMVIRKIKEHGLQDKIAGLVK